MKIKFYNGSRFLREEYDGASGDGGGASDGTEVFEDAASDASQGLEQEAQAQGVVQQSDPAQVALTPEQWAQVQATVQPQQQPVQQPQLTQEQIDEQLKVYRATPELAQSLFGDHADERQVQALQGMIDGIVTHLTTTMGYANQMVTQQMQEKFSPALDMVAERREKQFVETLTETYPALKGHDAVVKNVIQGLKAQGYNAPDAVTAARVVAQQTETLLKSADPQFSLAAKPAQQQQTTNNMPAMASSMGGAGGGAAGAAKGGGSQNKKPGWNVFD